MTRTTIQSANKDLSPQWANRAIDPMKNFIWEAAIMVDPVKRHPKTGEITRPYGFTTYPDGTVVRFDRS